MQTRVSSKGQIVLPAPLRRKLGIQPGDPLDIVIERDRIVLKLSHGPKHKSRVVEDPITGLPMLSLGPNAPPLTSEMVRELLTDFP
jgi:AbrB family looped-hinge helix DNA binding protein